MVSSQSPDVGSIEEKPSARSRKSYQNTSKVTLIKRHSPVDTQETVKAQPVQSTEALVAAVAAPAPDKKGKFTSGLCGCCQHICTCCMAMWCCTDAIIFGQMYEKQDPEKRKGSCKQLVGYFYLLYIVMIVFSVLGYHVYGETSTLGYPLATLSDIFYCLWVLSFVFAIGYLRYVARGVKNQSVRNSARRRRGPAGDPPQVQYSGPVLQ